MKYIVKILWMLISLTFICYLLLPNRSFPKPPPNSLQSYEPADVESFYRRSYFTNMNREEVMLHYVTEFERDKLLNIYLPTYRLNYPPEEAYEKVRDQTRSTFLEEIVHPFRESLYVNGFEPKEEKDTIFIDGRIWRQKITVVFITSSLVVRLLVGIVILFMTVLIFKQWNSLFIRFKKIIKL